MNNFFKKSKRPFIIGSIVVSAFAFGYVNYLMQHRAAPEEASPPTPELTHPPESVASQASITTSIPVMEAGLEDSVWIDIGNGPRNSEISFRTVNLKGLPSTQNSLIPLINEIQRNPAYSESVYLFVRDCRFPGVLSGFRYSVRCEGAQPEDAFIVIASTEDEMQSLLKLGYVKGEVKGKSTHTTRYESISGPKGEIIGQQPYHLTVGAVKGVATGLLINGRDGGRAIMVVYVSASPGPASSSIGESDSKSMVASSQEESISAAPEQNSCEAGLKRFVINEVGTFTKQNVLAIRKNCTTQRKEWLCFLAKAKEVEEANGENSISVAVKGNIEEQCGLH